MSAYVAHVAGERLAGPVHGHGHSAARTVSVSASGRHVRPMVVASAIGLGMLTAELLVGVLTGSLALLSDAAHLFTDVLGTGLALAAILLARRGSRSPGHTFGVYRAEVLAALANAVLVFGAAGYVLFAALHRLRHPPQVAGLPVSLTAAIAMAANGGALLLLRRGAAESLNVRGAYVEVLSDLVGSAGVLVSGFVTVLTGWRYADPIIGVLIAGWVLPRTWVLARCALRILFQHAPERLDIDSMSTDLGRVPGVVGVHDLHVWTLTSGMDVVSAHLTVGQDAVSSGVLRSAQVLLARRYQIEHATLQVETDVSARQCHRMSW